MSELPDHDRIRELLRQLATVQGESERIRERITNIRRSSPEFPDRRRPSRMFEDGSDYPAHPAAESERGDDTTAG